MKVGPEKIEYNIGKVKKTKDNVIVQDTSDMEIIEFWEDRLKELKQDIMVTYKEVEGVILYTIYTNLKKKGSPFRVRE